MIVNLKREYGKVIVFMSSTGLALTRAIINITEIGM